MQQKSELPEGWAISNLNEISDDIKYGYTASAEKNVVGPHLLRITDIQDGRVDWENVPFCKIKEDQILRYELKPNDIVFARTGATTGKSYLISSCPRSIFASYLIRLRPNENIDPKFLSLFFNTYDYWEQISQNMSGIAQPNCNAAKLKELILPLPPLPEQHRIVSAIEALFSRLDATNEKLDRVPEILKKFRKSVLAAACEGKLTKEWRKQKLFCDEYFATDEDQFNLIKQWEIPTIWLWTTLEDSCSHIVDCPHSTPKWTDTGVYCVRTSELKPGYIDFSNVKFVSEIIYLERVKRLEPQEGDILYSREGTVGIASLVPSNVKICLGQRLMLFRTKNIIIPNFFVKVLNSPYIYGSVLKNTMGSTAPRINVADIKKFPIPFPPLPEQQEIVHRVDALFAFADSIEAKVKAARENTEKLRQSILAKAFSGELVPTETELARKEGRDYEPAETLLERIKVERKSDKKR